MVNAQVCDLPTCESGLSEDLRRIYRRLDITALFALIFALTRQLTRVEEQNWYGIVGLLELWK